MFETVKYVRKPLYVDVAKVNAQNFDEVAKWVNGEILTDKDGKRYIKVPVTRAANERQTRAYIDDRVLRAGTGFKVYNPKAFQNNFEQVSVETTMQPTGTETPGPDALIAVVEQPTLIQGSDEVPAEVVEKAKQARPVPGPASRARRAADAAEAV